MDTTLHREFQAADIHPTLLERVIGRLPLPYWAGSLLLAIVFGPPGFLLYHYLDTAGSSYGLHVFFHGLHPSSLGLQIAGLVLWTLFLYATMILPHYIRVRVKDAQAKIGPLLPDGNEGYQRLFKPISYLGPTLLLAVAVGAIFADLIVASVQDIAGVFVGLYYMVNIPLTYLAIGASIWSYFGTLWGLYRLGKQPLKLRHAYEDNALGVKPIGSLSLAISYAYFSLLGLIVIVVALNPFVEVLGILLVILTILGTLMFFLPLLGVRRQMLKSKQELQAAIRQQWLPVMSGARKDSSPALMQISRILTLEVAERKAQAVSSWPFDTTILGKLAAIILSIMVAIITKMIIDLLERL